MLIAYHTGPGAPFLVPPVSRSAETSHPGPIAKMCMAATPFTLSPTELR
jgi:hypothetical protein